jgi:hypothetical protein
MKRSDIKVGVVYAHQDSKYRAAVPVAVIDTDTHWSTKGVGAERVHYATGQVLAVMSKTDYRRGESILMATPEKVEAACKSAIKYLASGDRTSVATANDERATVRMAAINPRFLVATWEDYTAEKEIAETAKAMREAEAEEASQKRVAAAKARVDALRAHGIPDLPEPREKRSISYRSDESTYDRQATNALRLTWEQVDALLSLIPEGAVYEPPPVDEWEYPEPEGQGAAPIVAVDDDTKAAEAEAAKPKRRTTGKSKFMSRTYGWTLSDEQRALLGLESHQHAMLIALAPTKAAVEEMLGEVGITGWSAENTAKGMKVRPLNDTWTTVQEWVKAGLATEESRGLYLVHEYHRDGPVVEITGEKTGRLLGRFETKRAKPFSGKADETIFVKAGK